MKYFLTRISINEGSRWTHIRGGGLRWA